ncbi:hypothetical protein [Curtobacterium sp. PhB115]|uniref:hypothetical protein n=1 Tax=Curtobacterium sp. PhB115 TaxID=2485173 RepID=UPI000FA8DEA5|nr:hypothetical protein [Curtobacterium sp. PhB115]ROP74018.1 hypothetical protein EDF19_0091 [Curtobacterium sp. PhB115]
MLDHAALDRLRQHPVEWRRRGLTPPHELAAMVAARLEEPTAAHIPADPSYADFFTV